jgi:hypothetical protein
MFKLRVVQANFGDCLIIEYGTAAAPRFMLIDGGPTDVFGDHLESELKKIKADGGKLDLIAISHVDNDHIIGLLDLLATIRDQRANNKPELIGIDGLWHNSFAKTLDPDANIMPQIAGLANVNGVAAPHSAAAILGIGEGNRVRLLAQQLGIPLNSGFDDDLICVDDAPDARTFGNLTVKIVGPTKANLEELSLEWEKWLEEEGPNIASGNPLLMANADDSVPNLSSVMFLATAENKTVLLTGDGRSDHLLAGLKAAGLLVDGKFHVDILKVMHHGSDRNATKTFFKNVTADTYVVSANGNPDNPDLSTLIWIVEAAKAQDRQIGLLFTNETKATKKLRQEYPPAEFGYTMTVLPKTKNSIVLSLAP